ncbi:T9SS type A sorting domain-containing protein, partial [bacterium]|nr:T9SS type A sorting domain-containing protein [bacterium]
DITASDNTDSSTTEFNIEVQNINDPPTFEPIGDGNIIMYEDSIYVEKWIQQISPGNQYENDNMSFILEFNDQELVITDPLFTSLSVIDSIFKISPELNANGETSFSVQLSDDGGINNGGNNMSESQAYILTINPVNDKPSIFNIPSNPLIINEDSEPFNSAYFSVKPGGGDGRFKESDDNFTFEIINDYDTDLFDIFPNINLDEFNNNIGVLSFSLAENYNGNTDFLVRVYDDGASSESPFNNALFCDTSLNVQINQINDSSIEFHNISELYNYQVDLSTFIGDTTFRFPYQDFYTSNQLANKIRFKWQNKDSLDIDLYPDINKDFTMDSVYYYLQMYNESDTITLDKITYQPPLNPLDEIVVDVDLTLDQYDIDLSGNTLYSFRVLAKNDQIDSTSSSDPTTISTDTTSYSFSVDLTLPTLDMNYLHDDIFTEHFDLYMKASENFVDFDNFNRPLKLWIYYNSVESQPEILFPGLKDTLNNIYHSSYDFKYPGEISFIHQMRDQAANINQDSLNISFGIIDPAYPSSVLFDNNMIQLSFPSNSVNNSIPCLISKINIDFDTNLDIIGYPIKIYPANIELNNSAVISFDLSIIPDYYDLNHCGLYYYDNNNWNLSNTYIEDNKLKSKINKFGSYAIFYNQYEETLSFPDEYILMQNHPNPFNPETMINFYIPEDNYVEVNIYSIKGEKVKTIYKGKLDSGYQSIRWNGKNDSDISLSSGIYIVSLNYNDRTINSKMVKLK